MMNIDLKQLFQSGLRWLSGGNVNERIRDKTRVQLKQYMNQPRSEISHRIRYLESGMDMERAVLIEASALGGLGLILGLTRHRAWFLLPLGIFGLMMWHGSTGSCPPGNMMRRMGLRSRKDMDEERYALKVLRGDFDHISSTSAHPDQRISETWAAVSHPERNNGL